MKASRNASLSGHGRVTSGPARKRVSGASPISAWSLRLYSCSAQAWVASFRKRKRQVRHVLQHGDQPALDRAPERLLLGVLIGAVGQRGVVQDAQPGEPLGDLGGRHCGAVVAQR